MQLQSVCVGINILIGQKRVRPIGFIHSTARKKCE